MRLIDLTVRNFRGFGPAGEAIDLSGDLILLYGPNGHGKTSLSEAIEWLFYGTTKRRQRGEEFSRAEYAGTFANAHGHAPTEVTLRVQYGDRDLALMRRLGDKEASETFVDGQRADFSSVGIFPLEAHYPVVAQHGLQTFVHSKPKDRRDAICAALGLDELTSLKSALESARSSFQRSPPQAVAEARKRLAELATGLEKLSSLDRVTRNWRSTPVVVEESADEQALIGAASMLVGAAVSTAVDALPLLRQARERASKSVFDLAPIAPLSDHDALHVTAASHLNELIRLAAVVDDRVNDLAGVTAASYGSALLVFWQEGLSLAPQDDDCPMCEAPTLTVARRDELARRLLAAKATVDADAALKAALTAWQEGVAPAGKAVAALKLEGMDEIGKAGLVQLLQASPECSSFIEAHDQLLAKRRDLGQALRDGNGLGNATHERSADAESLPGLIRERREAREAITSAVTHFLTSLAAYKNAWNAISEALAEKIAADDAVAQIDAVGKALRNLDDIATLAGYAAVLDETQELIRSVEVAAQAKQEALLQSRGQEVKEMYALLNPGASVGFDTMEPAKDSMKLHATSFGVRMPAAANLSECQLNCLGLAVWLMRATTPTSPFGFVLLDDPVQAMDDDHAEAFVAQVVPYLLDQRTKQVVVLSHVRSVIDKLRALNLDRSVRHYHFENFDAGGPVIVQQLRLQQALAEIKGGAKGNEANRMYAVDRLRVLLETFVRELHLKAVGALPTETYDTANSGQLADLFRTIPGTDPAEHAGMKDTIRFCDPAHHTQAGYSPPLRSNIQPHIDRVEGLMKKYGLI